MSSRLAFTPFFNTLSDIFSSDISDEISALWRKFCPANNFVRRKLCPTNTFVRWNFVRKIIFPYLKDYLNRFICFTKFGVNRQKHYITSPSYCKTRKPSNQMSKANDFRLSECLMEQAWSIMIHSICSINWKRLHKPKFRWARIVKNLDKFSSDKMFRRT